MLYLLRCMLCYCGPKPNSNNLAKIQLQRSKCVNKMTRSNNFHADGAALSLIHLLITAHNIEALLFEQIYNRLLH